MNEETVKLLAEHLGTTSEYLWGVLLTQAPISAVIDLVYIVIVIIMGIYLFKTHEYFLKEVDGKVNKYSEYEELIILPMLLLTIIWAIFMMASFFTIGDIINGFINPEYWALDKILKSR